MLSVFSPLINSAPACFYYRIDVPHRALDKFGFTTGHPNPPDPREIWLQATFQSDVAWLYMPTQLDLWNQIVDSGKQMNAISAGNKTKYPPVFIWDADDNPDFTSPFNQSFSHSGTKDIHGNPLEEGAEVYTTDSHGDKVVLWQDKKTQLGGITFDVERNKFSEKLRKTLIRKCDGATACSPNLISYYRDALGQKNVYFYPNTLNPEDYKYGIRAVREEPDNVVRIFWQGGQSHLHDWMPLKDAVRAVAHKYPNTKWVFMGLELPFIYDSIPASQCEFIPWRHYEAYRMTRTLMNVDINLCPLADTLFNRAKSAIKWYESTVSENTEATLAQDVGPYQEIKDGETGLLFKTPEEFAQKLGLLIEDASLRKRLGDGATKWVWSNRLPEHTTPGLIDFFNEIKDQQRARISPKIITTIPRSLTETPGGTS